LPMITFFCNNLLAFNILICYTTPMNTNKNQKIALIVGAVILVIVILTSQIVDPRGPRSRRDSIKSKRALLGGGVVATLTFVAFVVLKTKD